MTKKRSAPLMPEAGKSKAGSSGPEATELPPGLPPPDAAVPPPESDVPALEAGVSAPEPGLPASEAQAVRSDRLAWFGLLGFVVLAAAIIWVWQNPPPPSPELATLRQQVNALSARLASLENKPQPGPSAPAELAPLAAKVAALEARKIPPPVDLGPLQAAVAALAKRPAGDPALADRVGSMASRVDALSGKTDALGNKVDGLGNRLDTLNGRVDSLASSQAAIGQRVDTLAATLASQHDTTDARLSALAKDNGQISALADRSAHIARIQAAQAALASGGKLGDIPGAPAALSRFASLPPPTMASLRLSFAAAASAAMAASKPTVSSQPFVDRAWARVQDLITLRRGDQVIIGDPAAGVLARAKSALDAGDLAGAVAALDALNGPAAQAMAGWKAQAQALLDARKALAEMAARS